MKTEIFFWNTEHKVLHITDLDTPINLHKMSGANQRITVRANRKPEILEKFDGYSIVDRETFIEVMHKDSIEEINEKRLKTVREGLPSGQILTLSKACAIPAGNNRLVVLKNKTGTNLKSVPSREIIYLKGIREELMERTTFNEVKDKVVLIHRNLLSKEARIALEDIR